MIFLTRWILLPASTSSPLRFACVDARKCFWTRSNAPWNALTKEPLARATSVAKKSLPSVSKPAPRRRFAFVAKRIRNGLNETSAERRKSETKRSGKDYFLAAFFLVFLAAPGFGGTDFAAGR